MSIHCKPQQIVEHRNLLQFSFYPFPKHRQKIAAFLASSRVTAAEITPGLEGICRALVDEPRITAQIELPFPPPRRMDEGEWRRGPASSVGQKVGEIRLTLLRERRLALILDYVDVEHLVGIPCYFKDKLFGFLKYGNRTHTRFEFLLAKGNEMVTIFSTDDRFDELKLLREHIETLMPSDPIFITKIKE